MQHENIKLEEAIFKINKRVAELRKKKGMSQKKLALECELDESVIQRMERGKSNFTLKTLLIICQGLEISLPDFFSTLGDNNSLT